MSESKLAPAETNDPITPNWFWRFARMLMRPVVTLMFQLKVYGAQYVPSRGGVLIVSNHQSYLDPVLLGIFLRRPMAYLAKSELFENKYFAWIIRSLNAFPIRQGAGDIGAVKEIIARLKQGFVTNVFPEGTRTEDGELQPIQAGAALVIRRAGVPVIPCIIEGSFQAWPRKKKIFGPYPISVLYGPPLQVEGLKGEQIIQLIDRTLHQMVAELREIRRRSK
jgi:1-acyl-sn-glycerol-3-phosphate acyltransferase